MRQFVVEARRSTTSSSTFLRDIACCREQPVSVSHTLAPAESPAAALVPTAFSVCIDTVLLLVIQLTTRRYLLEHSGGILQALLRCRSVFGR